MKLVNYIWIVGLVFLAHNLSGFLETKVMAGEPFAWIYLFLWYLGFIVIGDLLIKSIFKIKNGI